MADREEWLKSLQEFGRGPDIASDYAALMNDPFSFREVDTTCAIAASYEAKAFGVKTGTPIWVAKKRCPHSPTLN